VNAYGLEVVGDLHALAGCRRCTGSSQGRTRRPLFVWRPGEFAPGEAAHGLWFLAGRGERFRILEPIEIPET